MDNKQGEYTMLTLSLNRKHRHIRPSKYISKHRRMEQLAAGRESANSFAFTGEVTDAEGCQAVERGGRRRRYTEPNARFHTGAIYLDAAVPPIVSRKGVHPGLAAVLALALVVVLGGVLLGMRSACVQESNAISARQQQRMALQEDCQQIGAHIAIMEGGMNIRLLAGQMGLVSCRGKQVNYLPGPQNAVITLTDSANILSLASIWGN